jgi:lysophospholipase L1-like esterase
MRTGRKIVLIGAAWLIAQGTLITHSALLAQTGPGGKPGPFVREYPVTPLAIVSFQVQVRTAGPAVKAHAFLRFFDATHREILTYAAAPIADSVYHSTGYYTEAPALARTLTLGVTVDAGAPGSVWVDSLQVDLNAGAALAYHAPLADLDDYTRPFWKGGLVSNETVLLYSEQGAPAAGRLLYQPDRIVSIRSFDLKTPYQEGRDYTLTGRTLTRVSGSRMPYRADTSFDQKDFAWFNLQSQWVVVTYTHHDPWKGPQPAYKGNLLPRAVSLLKAHRDLRIVAFGMSITRGYNVSGYDTVPPYTPTYVDLFARTLRQAYQDPKVVLFNAGLPGSVVDWGATYADSYVSPLHPDLVILDFGMNDFWRFTPAQFGVYIDTLMAKIRAKNASVEFILLANMQFDPAYLKNSDGHAAWYRANLLGYADELRRREGPGVACLDMTTLSGYIYDRKKPKDCVANPLHPNDYLARWYAQGLAALFVR